MRSRIESKVQAIEALLSDDELEPYKQGVSGTQPSNGTFAAKLRQVLLEIGEPAKVGRVTKALECKGVGPSGKSKLNTRVATELWRMAQKNTGGVHKVGYGTYVVKHEEQ